MNEQPVKRGPGRPRKIRPEQGLGLEAMPPEIPAPPDSSIHTVPGITESQLQEAMYKPLKVYIYPSFGEQDKGDGGIRRVVEGMIKHLPAFGVEIVQREEDADVIAYHAIVPPPFIKRFPRKTFVAICHGLYWAEYEWGNWALKANTDVMEGIRVADAVVTCSEWVANNIRRHTSRPVTLIPHGIDAEDWQYSDSSELNYVLWNKTRPDPVCDPEPVNEVAAIMNDIQFVTTFGREAPNVRITGKLDFETAKRIIEHAGVYLCTARETFGIGTLEAMACGVPIVGFRWGGQAEFVDHGVDGYLCNPGDTLGLAEGITWALNNRATIAPAARKKAESFTWDKACEQYAKVFREIHDKKTREAPRTSIIITNYNLHDYLTDCLKSVQNQSDQDWECIVVDDASPDATGKFITQTFADEDHRFKLIRNEKNVYLAEARNIGIRAAKGRYILPLDADDMLAPDAVQILAEALDSRRDIHIAYGTVRFVNEDGVTLTIYDKRRFEDGHSSWPFPFVFEQQMQQMNLLPYCSMYRKEAWEAVGGYRRRCRTAEDADLWVRLSSFGFRPEMVSSEDTLIYRNREGSMSRKQGGVDWIRWYSWSKIKTLTPAGAVTRDQLPVASLDPIIISVIIPLGPGHEPYVMDAIDSVGVQTFQSWECILINDTGKPLEFELPSWVRVLQTNGKTGPAHARNIGIEASRGRLFLPLDADDYLEPDALDFMYEAYRQTKSVIYTDFWQTGHDGKGLTIHKCDDYDPYLITGKSRMVDGERREGMMHSVTALTPKGAWQQIGGYDESIPAWEDWDFQISLGNIGVCSYRVPFPLFTYRKHTGFRRDQNYDSFEQSKEGILRKWRSLWEGGKELMACGSCAAKRYNVSPSTSQLIKTAMRPGEDAVLIAYNGEKTGAVQFKGQSRTVYWFGKGDIKYVLAQDVPMFLAYDGFKIVEPAEEERREPVLVADGPPIAD